MSAAVGNLEYDLTRLVVKKNYFHRNPATSLSMFAVLPKPSYGASRACYVNTSTIPHAKFLGYVQIHTIPQPALSRQRNATPGLRTEASELPTSNRPCVAQCSDRCTATVD